MQWQQGSTGGGGGGGWIPAVDPSGGSQRWIPALDPSGGSQRWIPAVDPSGGSQRWIPAVDPSGGVGLHLHSGSLASGCKIIGHIFATTTQWGNSSQHKITSYTRGRILCVLV
ncbi:unnamed protein product [Arctogadus glacialis]